MQPESPTHPDAPRAGGETPDILADLERYLDAYRDAIIAEQSAGPEYAAFDPDVDRAYERVNNLGTELRAKMAANQTAAASLLERHRDGERAAESARVWLANPNKSLDVACGLVERMAAMLQPEVGE